ncbi:aquaporin [Nibrella viscosa]|uniref:Aquaporin n=1 Tax=Nibrella viscosa TaxID=1084524 RepID=A0ABP8KTJ0_9BACT
MNTLRSLHWPEYLMEAAGLGIFMVSAGTFGTLLEYPPSPVRQALPNGFLRLVLMGMFMGLTAIGIFYSPWGKRSGAHINPAVTLTFYRLGKVKRTDAVFYMIFQCFGGLAGVLLVKVLLGHAFTDMPVRYVVTVPQQGNIRAFGVEILIAFCMMTMVLHTTNRPRWARYTSIIAGSMVWLYVVTTGPVSGFGMNPARTLASAVPANVWTAFWIYLLAPVTGMLTAADVYRRMNRVPTVKCAKMHHHNNQPCIFNCGYAQHEPTAVQDLQ